MLSLGWYQHPGSLPLSLGPRVLGPLFLSWALGNALPKTRYSLYSKQWRVWL